MADALELELFGPEDSQPEPDAELMPKDDIMEELESQLLPKDIMEELVSQLVPKEAAKADDDKQIVLVPKNNILERREGNINNNKPPREFTKDTQTKRQDMIDHLVSGILLMEEGEEMLEDVLNEEALLSREGSSSLVDGMSAIVNGIMEVKHTVDVDNLQFQSDLLEDRRFKRNKNKIRMRMSRMFAKQVEALREESRTKNRERMRATRARQRANRAAQAQDAQNAMAIQDAVHQEGVENDQGVKDDMGVEKEGVQEAVDADVALPFVAEEPEPSTK